MPRRRRIAIRPSNMQPTSATGSPPAPLRFQASRKNSSVRGVRKTKRISLYRRIAGYLCLFEILETYAISDEFGRVIQWECHRTSVAAGRSAGVAECVAVSVGMNVTVAVKIGVAVAVSVSVGVGVSVAGVLSVAGSVPIAVTVDVTGVIPSVGAGATDSVVVRLSLPVTDGVTMTVTG
jgi:hypothetical protein